MVVKLGEIKDRENQRPLVDLHYRGRFGFGIYCAPPDSVCHTVSRNKKTPVIRGFSFYFFYSISLNSSS